MANTQVMVLGTFHFHKEGVAYLDIRSEQRLKEIADVVARVSAFGPTKIAVELLPEEEAAFNEKYQKYVADDIIDIQNDMNERVMLGFQIGKKCKLDKLYAINHMQDWNYDQAYARARPDTKSEIDAKVQAYTGYLMGAIGGSISDMLKFQNTPDAMRIQHSDTFLIMNQIGAFEGFEGVDFVSNWYKRNLNIFANLQAICQPDDRVLVIYGAGHLATLVSFIQDYYKMDFVSPLAYL